MKKLTTLYRCTGKSFTSSTQLGPVAQSVTCLATDARLTVDPGVASEDPDEMPHSRRIVVSNKRKYVHEALVNCLFKLVQEKVLVGELTVLT